MADEKKDTAGKPDEESSSDEMIDKLAEDMGVDDESSDDEPDEAAASDEGEDKASDDGDGDGEEEAEAASDEGDEADASDDDEEAEAASDEGDEADASDDDDEEEAEAASDEGDEADASDDDDEEEAEAASDEGDEADASDDDDEEEAEAASDEGDETDASDDDDEEEAEAASDEGDEDDGSDGDDEEEAEAASGEDDDASDDDSEAEASDEDDEAAEEAAKSKKSKKKRGKKKRKKGSSKKSAAKKTESKKAESKDDDASDDDDADDSDEPALTESSDRWHDPALYAKPMTNEEAIDGLFELGPEESDFGQPEKSALYHPSMDERTRNVTSPMVFIITAVLSLILVPAAGMACLLFMAPSATLTPGNVVNDTVRLMQGYDIRKEREEREKQRLEQERQEQLAAMPKFGTVEIITVPNNLLVTAEGQPTMIFPGTRTDLVVPTRTKVIYKDIPVTEPFPFTVNGEGNFLDREVTIAPFGETDSPWIQDFSGNYAASLTYDMEMQPERARELNWRREYRGEEPLTGTVTVTTTPPGAFIFYNGTQLVDEDSGEPYVTPHTFAEYNAPPNSEDRTALPVTLRREGIRLGFAMEGKVRAAMGIYSHQFICNRKDGADWPAEDEMNPDFTGMCDYTYSVSVEMQDPPPPEEEGSGEGSGAASGEEGGDEEGGGGAGE